MNLLMGHAGVLTRAFRRRHDPKRFPSRPLRLVELGAGDGSLLLRLARRWSAHGVTAEVTLLDRQNLVSPETRRAFAALQWSVESVVSDAFAWLESPAPVADVMLANLFLHHFQEERLAALLQLAAARTNLFLACEPRRSPLALAAARSLALLGCNAVTRHDAVVSVRAGFASHELSALWPKIGNWELSEESVGLFSHSLIVSGR
ncbi:MAG: methyltransferase domain-containing protein [Verrucomicrobiales bacterium]|nr:methyltransferase domain-containing protein [Verrucomicrobiales bacterium]